MALPKKVDYGRLPGANLRELNTWVRPRYVTVRFHPLIFGSHSIDTPTEQNSKA